MEKKAVAVRRDTDGEIVAIKWDNGKVSSIGDAIEECSNGGLQGYDVRESKYGQQYLRSTGNDDKMDNLSMLPDF